MNNENNKCVIIMRKDLPIGIACNTAAILGITLGKKLPHIVGADVQDQNMNFHAGIIEFPVPILKADIEIIHNIRNKLFDAFYCDVIVVDFSDLAQGCKNYSEYIDKMNITDEKDLSYLGIALCGNKKKINKLTGNLPLFR